MPKPITQPIAVIADAQERELLYCSLYLKYGMHSDSFTVDDAGGIYPNPAWWRKRKIFRQSAVREVHCFSQGWKAGRKAEATASKVYEMWRPKHIPVDGMGKLGNFSKCQPTG
jgi:hypothetical protein